MAKKTYCIGVIDSISEAFTKWAKNFIIVVPFVFNFLISLLIIGLGIAGIFIVFLGSLTFSALQSMTETEMVSALENAISPGSLIFIVLAVLFLFLIITIVQSFFEAGAIGMAMELDSGRKTKLKTMWKFGRSFWLRNALLKIIFSLMMIVLIGIFAIPFILSQEMLWMGFLLLMCILIIFFFVMFAFAPYLLIIEDLGVFKSIKASWKFVGKRYWTVWGLLLMIGLISMVAGFIPYVSYILAVLIISPIQILSYVIYAMGNH